MERLAAEGCFGGWLEAERATQWVAALKEAVGFRDGCHVDWVRDGDGSGLQWTGRSYATEVSTEVYSDARLDGMLQGNKGEEEGEDEGRFLEGRRGYCSVKSLVRGIEERCENAGDAGDVTRRAWCRSPWEGALDRLTEILPWRVISSWRERAGPHTNVLEIRAKRRLVAIVR